MADQWAKGEPAGTQNASDIDSLIITNNAALDRLQYSYRRGCHVLPATVATITVTAGELAIPNSDGSIVRWRRNTSSTTVAWADIDTGAEAVSTQYYVWAIADADATTFTCKISTSSSAPSSSTYYRLLGFAYNNASGDLVNVGNVDVHCLIIETDTTTDTITDTTYGTQLTCPTVRFYLADSRMVKVTVIAVSTAALSMDNDFQMIIDIDGTDKTNSATLWTSGGSTGGTAISQWAEVLAAGTHTAVAQAKVSASTDNVHRKVIMVEVLH